MGALDQVGGVFTVLVFGLGCPNHLGPLGIGKDGVRVASLAVPASRKNLVVATLPALAPVKTSPDPQIKVGDEEGVRVALIDGNIQYVHIVQAAAPPPSGRNLVGKDVLEHAPVVRALESPLGVDPVDGVRVGEILAQGFTDAVVTHPVDEHIVGVEKGVPVVHIAGFDKGLAAVGGGPGAGGRVPGIRLAGVNQPEDRRVRGVDKDDSRQVIQRRSPGVAAVGAPVQVALQIRPVPGGIAIGVHRRDIHNLGVARIQRKIQDFRQLGGQVDPCSATVRTFVHLCRPAHEPAPAGEDIHDIGIGGIDLDLQDVEVVG